VLQHPREAQSALGTVRILRRALPDVTVRVGVDFSRDPEISRMIRVPAQRGLLLYPGDGANPLEPEAVEGRLTLVAIDGTWAQARSIVAANPWLATLSQLRLSPRGRSVYAVRRQPYPWGLCTLEAVAEALALLDHDADAGAALLRPLRAMIGMHVACGDAGSSDVRIDRQLLEREKYLPAGT